MLDLESEPESLPPLLADIPDCLHHSPFALPRRKRSRRQGKRGGILLRFKAYLKSHGVKKPRTLTGVLPSFQALWDQSSYRFSCHRWIRPVGLPAPSDLPAKPLPVWRWVWTYRGGMNLSNLRPLGSAAVSNNHSSDGHQVTVDFHPKSLDCSFFSSPRANVAPLRTKRTKSTRQPWLNEATCALRCECRGAERNWIKNKLQVSLRILRDCLTN